MLLRQLAILGARSSGHKVLTAARGDPRIIPVCFGDDVPCEEELPVHSMAEAASRGMFISGIGSPTARKRVIGDAIEYWGLGKLTTVQHQISVIEGIVDQGVLICPFVTVSYGAAVEMCVTLNVGSVIGPDAHIESFVTVNQQAVIAAECSIGEMSYIGMGARILQGLKIAPRTMIGAGAVVTKDIEEPGTYIGIPARRVGDWEDV